MRVTSTVEAIPTARVRQMLSGLPTATGFRVVVKPLRYRHRPHLAAQTDFVGREIQLQVPEPFFPFGEVVAYAAKRRPGRSMRFIWLTEGVTFRSPREVIRFLYLHEWMHIYGTSRRGGRRVGETACDRFALLNYMKDTVTAEDAEASLRWRRPLRVP